MKYVLDPVQDHRPGRIVRHLHDALHAQHVGAVVGLQELHEELQPLRADGIGLAEAEGTDMRIVA